ncbi:hypothetical protein IAT38_002583 [Cryptococcus sp. DSM 104549]
MRVLYNSDQPVAGPSSRPYYTHQHLPPPILPTPTQPAPPARACPPDTNCPFLYPATNSFVVRGPRVTDAPQRAAMVPAARGSKLERWDRFTRRAGEEESSSASSSDDFSSTVAAYEADTTASANSSSFDPSASISSTFYNDSSAYPTDSSSSYSYNASYSYTYTLDTSSRISSTTKSARSTTFTSLWSYSATRSASSATSSSTKAAYVPGVVLNMTLGGDSDTEAVYSVGMVFGHNKDSARRKRASYKKDGELQTMNLQVDLGSSDMWVATANCTSTVCNQATSLYNANQSLDSGVETNITYQTGAVDGRIYWEEVLLGGFGIGYQAFIAATTVTDEDLKGGDFAGVLGLALPAASTILTEIGGTTGSNPDGATFLDNLFGAGSSAPTERLFSLSLERREDVRTLSTLGIGAISPLFCPSPCKPPYIPIIAQPSLGSTGYLHWRVQMQGVSVTTWDNQEQGTGPTTKNVTLGTSMVYPSKSSPLAVLDSGGVQILVAYRQYADAIYGAMGIGMSSDGLYRMPCTKQMALTFTFGGQSIPVHPLDMSYVDTDDASQQTCIGMIQYSSNLGDSGDFILGSSFMKNAYSVFKYPDPTKHTTWQPTVGLIPLTNASVASQDFYAVRVKHQSLGTVSTNSNGGGNVISNTGGGSDSSAHDGKKAANTAIIAATSVVGFFVLAAALFCAWWFWLRRKFGAGGVVTYRTASKRRPRPDTGGHRSDHSMSTLRSKKHEETHRQKSMIDGFVDYEADSWMSGTEGGDSIRLGYIPEALEEGEDEGRGTWGNRSSRGSSMMARDQSAGAASGKSRQSAASGDEGGGVEGVPLVDAMDPLSPKSESGLLASPVALRRLSMTESDPPTSSASDTFPHNVAPYPHPSQPHQTHTARSLSMAMTGPFPSPSRMSGPFPTPSPNRYSSMRPDSSPMYDIRASDYFTVPAASPPLPRGRRGSSSTGVGGAGGGGGVREGSGHRRSSPSKQGARGFGVTVAEKPDGDDGKKNKEGEEGGA